MGFKVNVDVEGLDAINKLAKEFEHSPEDFNEWANRVTRTAKQLCNDSECKRIKLVRVGHGEVDYEFKDREAIDCVIQSIRSHLNSMPFVQQEIFKRLIPQLEVRKSQMSA
jgi:hypothetical protein